MRPLYGLSLLATLAASASAQPVTPFTLLDRIGGDNVRTPLVARDADGNTYVAGDLQGTVDFEPDDPRDEQDTFVSGGTNNAAYVVSYDPDGALRWSVFLPAASSSQFYSVNALALGETSVFITGNAGRGSLSDFDPGPDAVRPTGGGNNYIAAYDRATGALQWVNGRDLLGRSTALVATDDGGVVAAGDFRNGTRDFDPGPGTSELTANLPTTWVARYAAADGAFDWAGAIASTSTTGGTVESPNLAAAGDLVVVSGVFTGTADLDPGDGTQPQTAVNGDDVYASALDATSGAFAWGFSIGSVRTDEPLAATADADAVYLSGRTGEADFDPGDGTVMRPRGAFLAAYDRATGAFRWVDSFDEDVTWSSLASDGARLYTTGSFSGAPDFDPGDGTATLTATPSGANLPTVDVALAAYTAADGAYVWAGALGATPSDDAGSGVAVSLGRVATTGTFGGSDATGDFDPGPGTAPAPSNAPSGYLSYYDAATGAYAPMPVAGEEGAPARGLALAVWPNPARGAVALALTLDAAQDASVRVFDALGREVARLHDGPLAAGPHTLRLDAAALPAGVYVLRLRAGGETAVRRLAVVR